MTYDNHDNNIRAKFESYTPGVDESVLWADIESALPKKSDDKRFLFILILIGAVGVAFVIGVSKLSFTAEVAALPIERSGEDALTSRIATSSFQKTEIEKELLTDFDEAVNQVSLVQSIQGTQQVVKPRGVGERPLINSQKYIVKFTANTQEVAEDKIYNINTLPSANSQSITIKAANSFNGVSAVPKLSIRNHPAFTVDRDLGLQFDFAEEDIVLKPTPWSIDFAIGGGKVLSQYTAQSVSGEELINLREGVERDLESYSSSLSIQYQIGEQWSLGLGLSYLTQVTSSRVSTFSDALISLEDTVAILHTGEGMQVQRGPREFLETTRSIHLRYQRSQQLLLPLSIRYNNALGKKWGYQFGVGYGFDLWSDHSGIVQDVSDQAYDLNTDTELRLESTGSDRLILESHITRELAGIGLLKFGATYLHDLKGRYRSDYFIQKKSHSLQLSGGLIIPLKF